MATRQREVSSEDYIPKDLPPPPGIDMSDVYDSRKARLVLVERPIGVVGEREFKDVLEHEQFMEEMVLICIPATSDVNEPWVVPVGINGDTRWLQRDKKYMIERKFLECLTRFNYRYTMDRNPDPNATEGYSPRTHASNNYMFTVLWDPNPRGRAWLERMFRENR